MSKMRMPKSSEAAAAAEAVNAGQESADPDALKARVNDQNAVAVTKSTAGVCRAIWKLLPGDLTRDIRDVAKLPSADVNKIGTYLRGVLFAHGRDEEISEAEGVGLDIWSHGVGFSKLPDQPEGEQTRLQWHEIAALLLADTSRRDNASHADAPAEPHTGNGHATPETINPALADALGIQNSESSPTPHQPEKDNRPQQPQRKQPSGREKLEAAESDHRQRVKGASDDVARWALEQVRTGAAHKMAKAEFKLAVDRLENIVNRGPEYMPLFDANGQDPRTDQPGKSEPAQPSTVEAAFDPTNPTPAEAATDAPNDTAADETWRAITLAETPIPAPIVAKLAAANILTVGQLSDYTVPNAAGFSNELTSIAGIGKAKAEKIEAAMVEFWATRKEAATT